MTGTRIAVVGAGVGGLVTGVALAAAGVRCTLFEQSGALDGGGTVSLMNDAQAKVVSSALLRMEVDVPDEVAAAVRGRGRVP